MCIQCMANAIILIEDVLPGYFLMVSTTNCEEWPLGHYALVQQNDPDFIWKGKPIIDPLFNWDDYEINNLPDNSKEWEKSDEFYKFIESIEPKFITDTMCGFELVQTCIKEGYNIKKHGKRIIAWLMHHIAVKLENNKHNK